MTAHAAAGAPGPPSTCRYPTCTPERDGICPCRNLSGRARGKEAVAFGMTD